MKNLTFRLTGDDNGTYLVTCDEIPGLTTYGTGVVEALYYASDAYLSLYNPDGSRRRRRSLRHANESDVARSAFNAIDAIRRLDKPKG